MAATVAGPAASLLRRLLFHTPGSPQSPESNAIRGGNQSRPDSPPGTPPEQPFNNYLRGVLWSPDGSFLLTNSQDHVVRVFETRSLLGPNFSKQFRPGVCPTGSPQLPTVAPGASEADVGPDGDADAHVPASNRPSLCLPHGEAVHDMAWHPLTGRGAHPESCLFATAGRGIPVKLSDARDGRVRAMYRAVRNGDELVAPLSLAFEPRGDWLYASYASGCVRAFQVERPSAPPEVYRFEGNRKRAGGRQQPHQRGIVSCLHVDPNLSGTFAVGTYSGDIGVYSQQNGQQIALLPYAHASGVTQVRLLAGASMLLSAGRRDGLIRVWDLRYTKTLLAGMRRCSANAQPVGFDVCPAAAAPGAAAAQGSVPERMVVSASQEGFVRVFDLCQPAVPSGLPGDPPEIPTLASIPVVAGAPESEDPGAEPGAPALATVNCVSVMPGSSHLDFVLAAGTGARRPLDQDSDDSDEEDGEAGEEGKMQVGDEDEPARPSIPSSPALGRGPRTPFRLGENAVGVWRIH